MDDYFISSILIRKSEFVKFIDLIIEHLPSLLELDVSGNETELSQIVEDTFRQFGLVVQPRTCAPDTKKSCGMDFWYGVDDAISYGINAEPIETHS